MPLRVNKSRDCVVWQAFYFLDVDIDDDNDFALKLKLAFDGFQTKVVSADLGLTSVRSAHLPSSLEELSRRPSCRYGL